MSRNEVRTFSQMCLAIFITLEENEVPGNFNANYEYILQHVLDAYNREILENTIKFPYNFAAKVAYGCIMDLID